MLSMTPREPKQLGDVEAAFLEALEAPMPQTATPTASAKSSEDKHASSGGWLSNLADRLLMQFVCCAPPKALLDDHEIAELLAAADAPSVDVSKPKPANAKRVLQRNSSSKDRQARRSFATIVPVAKSDEPSTTEDDQETNQAKNDEPAEAASASVAAPQEPTNKPATKRAAFTIQRAWAQYQTAKKARVAVEPKTASPLRPTASTRAKRSRKQRSSTAKSNSCSLSLSPAVRQRAMWSPVRDVAARKRSRSTGEQKPQILFASVERDVRWSYFNDEEIDDDELVQTISSASATFHLPESFLSVPRNGAVSRCAFAPPMLPTFCPIQIHVPTMMSETAAASRIQSAWRCMKARRELTSLRCMKQYEEETQSVMPTIRNKMALLRKRLVLMKERSSSSDEASAGEEIDDDFNFL